MLPNNKDISVYIHWPYCLKKCPYCDFNSHVSKSKIQINEWKESYKKEILNFVNSINGEVVNYASANDGLHALKAGLAAKNSLQNNCVETVN